MDIVKKINTYEEELKILNESGLRHMRRWSKHFKTAEGYFHQDL